MELIYSMRRKPLKCEPPHFDSALDSDAVRPICTISTANIIAFSSTTELTDVDGDSWGGHVYVCDLDTPWHSYKVASTPHPVSALEWDIEGKQLLVATTVGEVTVYGQKDFLLNEWQSLYTASFPGEHIIKSAFFHNGRRVIALDKKAEAPISDRIQTLRSTPTLKGFGGVAAPGACVVTATGLVGAIFPRADSAAASTATEPLRSTREHVTAASIAYKNGNLLVAAICVGRARCVRCVRGSVSRVPPAVHVQPLPAVYLLDGDVPVSLTWSLREDTDSLLIAGSTLSLWKCTERAHPVHKLLSKGNKDAGNEFHSFAVRMKSVEAKRFERIGGPLQGSTTPGGGQKPGSDSFNTVIWQKTAVWPIEGEAAVGIASTKLPLGSGHCVLATRRALHLLARDTHHVLCSRAVVSCGPPGPAAEAPPAAGSPPKKPNYGPARPGGAPAVVCCVELCYLGGAVVCVDSFAQLHVYRLPQPWADIPTPISVQHAATLLEYSIISGYDCLDILMTFKHNIIEPIYERLSETFQRQSPIFQQYYYHSWLKLKTALCRRSPNLACVASSLTSVQMCHAVLAACGASLRDDEAAPFEDIEDEKSILALEAKPEAACESSTLQAMRLGLQRALDVAVTAVAQHAQPNQHGYDVWSEPSSLSLVRKLVVLGRAAGRGGDALSRLLARLNHPARHEIYEECSALAAQSNSPRVWEALPRCAVSAPHGRPLPLYLEYGVEPESLRYAPEPPAYAQCETVPPLAMDSIRYMYLGGAGVARRCARCGARALPAPHTQRHPLQRAHDARFLPLCRCGGNWSLCKNI